MTPALPNNDPWAKIRELERRIAMLERTPSGPWSIGVDRLRPMVANAPSDSLFSGLPEPLPTGIQIWDPASGKFRVRRGPNDYPGVTLA